MSSSEIPLDISLIQKENYITEFKKLALRIAKEPRLMNNAPVIDDLSLSKILRNPDLTIDLIIDQIKNKKFIFENPKIIELVTADKKRQVTIWPWPERIILMVLQKILTQKIEQQYSKKLFSFIKGRSTLHAKLKLKKYLKLNPNAILAKRDVSGYGDAICRQKLFQQLSHLIDFDNNPATEKIIRYALGDKPIGIPTGSPLTPFFENVYLMSLDQWFESICAEKHFYARYGDDFVFASLDQNWIDEASLKSDSILLELGLTVAEHKKLTLKYTDKIQSVSWLGSSFKKNGLVASRHKHSDQVYSNFKKYFSNLFQRLAKDQMLSDIKPIIQTALDQYFSHRDNPALGKILSHHNDPITTKMLDKNTKFLIVHWTAKYFKVGKRPAWQFLRTLNIPSLNYQRRFLYRLDKYE